MSKLVWARCQELGYRLSRSEKERWLFALCLHIGVDMHPSQGIAYYAEANEPQVDTIIHAFFEGQGYAPFLEAGSGR